MFDRQKKAKYFLNTECGENENVTIGRIDKRYAERVAAVV